MKNLRDILIVVAVGATLFFPADADAGPFKKRKAKREAKRAATVQYTSPDCTITDCPTHSQPGTGQLGINKDGGFTGQLSNRYYADQLARQAGVSTPAEAPTEVPDVPAEAAPAEIPIVVAPAGTVADAQAAVEAAERNVLEKQEALKLAEEQQYNRDRLELIALRAEVDSLDVKHDQSLDKLLVRMESLQDKLDFPPPPPPPPPDAGTAVLQPE